MSGLLRGRLAVVTAAAGYGKTDAVRGWLRDGPATWNPEPGEGHGKVVVVDDAHRRLDELDPDALGQASQLVLITRRPIPPATLFRFELGAPTEVGPRSLALPPHRVARLLADRYGIEDPDLAADVHRLTAGWPALTQLVGAALEHGTGARADETLTAPGTTLHDYLASEVLDELPPAMVELLGAMAELGSVSVGLADALGHQDAAAALTLLSRIGLLQPPVPGHEWYTPVPAVAAVARARVPRSSHRARYDVALAAQWCIDHDRPADALRLTLGSGDHVRCARLLAEHGQALLMAGAAVQVVRATRTLPAAIHTRVIELLYADSLQAIGDAEGAIAVYVRLAAQEADRLPAELAWRYGAAVYLSGDPREALAVLRRGRLGSRQRRRRRAVAGLDRRGTLACR